MSASTSTVTLQSSRLCAPFPPRTHKKKQETVKQYLVDKFGLVAHTVRATGENTALVRSIHQNTVALINAKANKKPNKKKEKEKD
jgi:hypothetical protein